MLFAKVKVPSLNVERNNGPDHIAGMRLWSNFIRFCNYRFLCRGSGDINCVSAEQSQGKSYKMHALLIETVFLDTYAALSEPVLFARVKYYLSLPVFAKKKYLVSLWRVGRVIILFCYSVYNSSIYILVFNIFVTFTILILSF